MSAQTTADTTAHSTATSSAVARARRGVMLIIASPSGAGKSTLARLLLETDKSIGMSVSVTTRPRRPSEVDGVHYRFIAERDFHLMVERSELLEHAQVHGNYYGTPRAPVEAALEDGRDVLFDIDVQGTLQLYQTMRPDVASVFILPPSIAELEKRLARRAEDDPATIRRRLTTARDEIARWTDYDYVLVNDDLDRTFRDLVAILQAERVRRSRRESLGPLVDTLSEDLARVLATPAG